MKIRIALHHHLAIGIINRQHVGTGTDRVPVQCDIALLHPRLRIEAIHLLRDGRKKRHCQPVKQLRIFPVDPDPVGVTVNQFYTLQRVLGQVEIDTLLFPVSHFVPGTFQCPCIVFQSDDVLAHQAKYRGM